MSDPVVVTVRPPFTNSGGQVQPARVESGTLDGRGNILILVHGYNNSRTDALDSYKTFLGNLKAEFGTLTMQAVEFLWPGDTPVKIISTLSYPNQIRPAIESASELSKFLSSPQLPGPVVVNLVGHSLGCRVILELLKLWVGSQPASVSIGVVALMAAAVVIKQVEVNGVLRAAAISSSKNPVLYSKGDPVLHWVFPIGETAAGEGFFPTAVGRTGGPLATWHVPQPMSHNGKPYVHGSYWPGDESATAVAVALGGAPARSTPENAVITNPAPAEHSVPARFTPIQTLISRPAFA